MTKKQSTLDISGKVQQPNLLKTLLWGAGAALVVKIISAGIDYATQVLLARWMGVKEYGVYDFAFTLSIFLAFLAGLGLPTALLRLIPEYQSQQKWTHLRGIIWGSWRHTWIASLLTASFATILLLWLHIYQGLQYAESLILGIWTVPLIALAALQQEIVRAFHRITLAFAPFLIAYPLLLMGLGFISRTRWKIDSQRAIILSILALFLVLSIQLLIFYRGLTPEIKTVRPVYTMGDCYKVSLPLMFIDGSFMILSQIDILMIGTILGAEDVGIYSAALKTSLWVNLILSSVNAISAPMFASLYAQGNTQGLQRLVSMSARWMFFPAFAVALGLIIFAEPILKMFGGEFVTATPALIALMLGQLVNVGTGSVGYLLMMTGHHKQCARVVGCSALVNVVLNLIGIHWLGILGAALATAFSMALWNIWLHHMVVKYLRIQPSVIAAFF